MTSIWSIRVSVIYLFFLKEISYLGDVRFDAFGQFDAGFPEELGQLVWDVLVLIQSIQ